MDTSTLLHEDPELRAPALVRAQATTRRVHEHTVEIVSDPGEGAQKCGQIFGAVSAKMGNGVWTVEIIPAEIQPPPRIPEGQEALMKTQIAYCSACDRDVRIVIPDQPVFDGQGTIPDPEIICLEIGDRCTGSLCPIGAQPPAVMAARLVRSGLTPIVQPLMTARCDACQQVTSFAVISRVYATCTECGTTTDRERLSMPTSN